MKQNLLTIPCRTHIWEDLVLDFLEMACFLESGQSRLLLRALRREKFNAQSIAVYPCFAVAGRFVIVLDRHEHDAASANGGAAQCWLFDPDGRVIKRAAL